MLGLFGKKERIVDVFVRRELDVGIVYKELDGGWERRGETR